MDIDKVCEMFRGKKVTVLGLGLLGRGVGDAEFIARCGANVVVTDKKNDTELKESVEKLKKYENVQLHLGGHVPKDFTECDMVIKAAGVSLHSSEITAARNSGIPVYMSTALFTKFAIEGGATVLGVTGTRGKSTVVHMIFRTLRKTKRRVHLGGNIRGVSTLALTPQIEAGDIVVLELDSWQLQGFGDIQISPHVSIFTNLLQDHKNYYRTEEAYFADKANIFKFQHPGDVLIAGAAVAPRIRMAAPPLDPIIPEQIPASWKLKVLGEHNRENASLAAAALGSLGLSDDDIRAGLESFESVEGRLQFVREINGVGIYNDNNATTPEAAVAALRALGGKNRNIILIMGGADKGLDTSELVKEIGKACKAVVLLSGTGTDKLAFGQPPIFSVSNLAEAVTNAIYASRAGDVILFSPAFASFGMFKNEYDRNDQFIRLVKNL